MAKCMDWPLCNGAVIGLCECETVPVAGNLAVAQYVYTVRTFVEGQAQILGNYANVIQAKESLFKSHGIRPTLWEAGEQNGLPFWTVWQHGIGFTITTTKWNGAS